MAFEINLQAYAAGLMMALAKTKHARASEVIAGELHNPNITWAGLQALAQLQDAAPPENPKISARFASQIRNEAKKSLKKLGVTFDAPPPKHVVKGRLKIPKGLQEWSSNLEMEGVEPTLKKLGKHVDRGFGAEEIAEVIGVLELMPAEQTKTFRFPITAAKKPADLWVAIFMDDIDSPDVSIHAPPEVIAASLGRLR